MGAPILLEELPELADSPAELPLTPFVEDAALDAHQPLSSDDLIRDTPHDREEMLDEALLFEREMQAIQRHALLDSIFELAVSTNLVQHMVQIPAECPTGNAPDNIRMFTETDDSHQNPILMIRAWLAAEAWGYGNTCLPPSTMDV